MPYPHPQYKDILVYTDKPRAGAFYQVKKDDSLSRLANRAYGSGTAEWWGMINLSAYNSKFPRRKKSTRCSSPKRTFPDGFIAFCKYSVVDPQGNLSKTYPILWIPPAEGGEPQHRFGPIEKHPDVKRLTTKTVGPLVKPLIKPNATMPVRKFPSAVKRAFAPGRTFSATQAANTARTSAALTRTIREEQYPTIEADSSQWGSIFLLAGVGLAGIVFAVKAGTEK